MLDLPKGSKTQETTGTAAVTPTTNSTSMQKFSMPCQINGVSINTGPSVLNILYH